MAFPCRRQKWGPGKIPTTIVSEKKKKFAQGLLVFCFALQLRFFVAPRKT
jgi:hypothetical protein